MTQFLIVDDDTLFTRALEQELARLRPEALIHRAVRVESATRLLQINRYDVIFLDLRLPDAQGIGVVTTTARLANGSKIVVVSAYDDPRLMRAAFEEGAVGFLPKALDLPATQAALQQVLDRGFYFPPEALSAPCRGLTDELTKRERDVLEELASGISTKHIARKLGLAPTTVDKHVDQIRVKFGVATRLQLVAKIRDMRGTPGL
jgi:DNA-binding NarL/FixJ family response regulator